VKRLATVMALMLTLAAIVAQAQTTCPVAQITSPTPGSTLPGSTVTFQWCNASADYFLTVESILGAHDIFFAVVRVNSVTLINLPTTGRTVFVTLWTQGNNGNWQNPFQYTYTAAGAPSPTPSPAANYTLSASTTRLSVGRGQSGSITVTMTPENGFNGTVAFNCAGLPVAVTCQFTPAQLVGNAQPAVTTLMVSVSAATAMNHGHPARGRPGMLAFGSLGVVAFGLMFAGGTQTQRRTRAWLLTGCALVFMVLLVGCGGGSSTPAAQTTQPATQPTPQPATGPQTVSAAVVASAAGGTLPAANPNQQFQVQITIP
jgi:hypothetical protein